MENLLKQFGLEHLLQQLVDAGIEYRHLEFLNESDIADAIKQIGDRAEFRVKLFNWRATLNLTSGENQNRSFGGKPLRDLLNNKSGGRKILQYYRENDLLTNRERDELVQIILEDCFETNAKLKPEDIAKKADEIVELFPSEKNSYNYYYIPRHRNKNPSGKLYCKYFNLKTKQRKLNPIPESNPTNDAVNDTIEVDSTLGNALKVELQRDLNCWNDVVDKWQRTFTLRQSELAKFSNIQFLLEWPKLKDARAAQLIDIDFEVLYPGRNNFLKGKWDSFKKKIAAYYEINIRNSNSRQLLSLAKSTNNIDSEDYILTILLNSILLPTAMFKGPAGSKSKKTSIDDAIESFVLELPCISDYERKISYIIDKFYENHLTLQPYILVVGSAPNSLQNFYVYMDGTLYKSNSFVDSLDLCFKLYHILNLKYPKICEVPWLLIQKYFFNIDTEKDLKTSSLTALLAYLRH